MIVNPQSLFFAGFMSGLLLVELIDSNYRRPIVILVLIGFIILNLLTVWDLEMVFK